MEAIRADSLLHAAVRCYTIAEASKILNTSQATLRRMMSRGEITAFRIPNQKGGRIHFSDTAIREYVSMCEGRCS